MGKANINMTFDIEELSSLFEKSKSLDDFLQAAVSVVPYHMRAAVCSIYIYDEKTRMLTMRASQGLSRDAIGKVQLPLGHGLVGLALKELRLVCVGCASESPDFLPVDGVGEEKYKAFMAVPIRRQLTRVGVLVVQDFQADYFNENDEPRRQADAKLETAPSVKKETRTADGIRIQLFANINLLSDLELANKFSDDGVGLYRSEFPFLIRDTFPMEEEQHQIYRHIVEARELVQKCMKVLDGRGVPYNRETKLGIMVELPSAVSQAEDFAREVDFMSIGTNDLIQYMLAVDRTNAMVSRLYLSYHPAILRAIEHVAAVGKSPRTDVSVCGDIARDPQMIPFLLGAGITKLSIAPRRMPDIQQQWKRSTWKRRLPPHRRCSNLAGFPRLRHS